MESLIGRGQIKPFRRPSMLTKLSVVLGLAVLAGCRGAGAIVESDGAKATFESLTAAANDVAFKEAVEGTAQRRSWVQRFFERSALDDSNAKTVSRFVQELEPGIASRRWLIFAPPEGAQASPLTFEFQRDFTEGARRPSRVLSDLKEKAPALSKRWLEVPKRRRVFVVGARRDEPKVALLCVDLERQGFRTFFYMDCISFLGALCSNQEIGALFKESGQVLVYDTPNARNSDWVRTEAFTIHGLQRGYPVAIARAEDILDALRRMKSSARCDVTVTALGLKLIDTDETDGFSPEEGYSSGNPNHNEIVLSRAAKLLEARAGKPSRWSSQVP